ncbi:MAG: alpha-hydroxy-acid oxidizing protein [Pseudonocardia sp.]|uniref:alpha-hydroxy acid oxidase n=1 Tax=unclassified Pseudonocardia TaxID=2619320 RepID=UPI00086F2D5F|nr:MULTISPECIES: alpha-hydroxy acid oxidase [unclassified Pseudonocardia]MBN9109353.1 alpha-hydroxy-acid oxidizing protein [Pseudonocardia sp.]ODU29508.1 MAG: alpha-hydroxy-acid oxidizing enzyme [Pseudonocardia sp. SCN 72-51]ODV08066.1 MAG: alpha-hydroxy-acid oxidizing enzyme [Pseudonocardia sp. SCN 73-27]
MNVDSAVTLADLERLARRRLPRPVFDLVEGAAGDEVTAQRNLAAYRGLTLRPRSLAEVGTRSLATTVLGQDVSMPVMLAPTGAGRLLHRTAELAVAGAAADAGTVYMQSTVSAFGFEEVSAAARGTAWVQLYLPPTDADTRALVRRVADAGYRGLAVTVDTPVLGNRERDSRNGLLNLPMWHPRALAQGLSRPLWGLEFLRGNVSLGPAPQKGRRSSLADTRTTIANAHRAVTRHDLEVVRAAWDGPLLVKGIMRHDEVDDLVDLGVDGIVVSNHGGRQLDGVAGTIDVLPAVVAAAAGRAEVFVDGGIRRGTDVVKALALGARGVFVGRPYLYGLAAGGRHGVARALDILRAELDKAMALVGAPTVDDIDASLVEVRVPQPAG